MGTRTTTIEIVPKLSNSLFIETYSDKPELILADPHTQVCEAVSVNLTRDPAIHQLVQKFSTAKREQNPDAHAVMNRVEHAETNRER